ncbi:hypothetical protein CLOM_g4139 [Closterium sp. NIES-68]|nr:hypothetical protein CLOM_g4139 [Closterium sp. NIES-68]
MVGDSVVVYHQPGPRLWGYVEAGNHLPLELFLLTPKAISSNSYLSYAEPFLAAYAKRGAAHSRAGEGRAVGSSSSTGACWCSFRGSLAVPSRPSLRRSCTQAEAHHGGDLDAGSPAPGQVVLNFHSLYGRYVRGAHGCHSAAV